MSAYTHSVVDNHQIYFFAGDKHLLPSTSPQCAYAHDTYGDDSAHLPPPDGSFLPLRLHRPRYEHPDEPTQQILVANGYWLLVLTVARGGQTVATGVEAGRAARALGRRSALADGENCAGLPAMAGQRSWCVYLLFLCALPVADDATFDSPSTELPRSPLDFL